MSWALKVKLGHQQVGKWEVRGERHFKRGNPGDESSKARKYTGLVEFLRCRQVQEEDGWKRRLER